ncbi:hypothetical protein P7M67_00510 [Vibrio parahaemolyticus]|nr:hypothetical protein [Vibrio parahaemolyticus]
MQREYEGTRGTNISKDLNMTKCIFRCVSNPFRLYKGKMVAKYIIHPTWFSYDYSKRLDALELFELWVSAAREKYPSGFVNIVWLVNVEGQSIAPMLIPRQPICLGEKSFLFYFSEPWCEETGQLIDWSTLPVEFPKWDENELDGHGFIEHVTGWQPSILQTKVSIDFLIEAAKKKSEEVQ